MLNHRPFQGAGLDIIHFLRRFDAETISESLLIRAGLKLGFG